jgi:hypothetical protein
MYPNCRVKLTKGGEEVEATWRFATWADTGLLQGWQEYLGPDSSGNMQDSADFARQAVLRWQSYADQRLLVDSLIAGDSAGDGNQEFAALMVMTADWWFRPGEPMAFAYFRRTWSGGIYLEFMAGHPLAEGQIRGLLRATIRNLAIIAEATQSHWLWWEATAESHPKYQKNVGPLNTLDSVAPPVRDLFLVRTTDLQSDLQPDTGSS